MNSGNHVRSGGRYILSSGSLTVGSVMLPNRIVFPAWQLNYAGEDGSVTDKLLHFYSRLAGGGCGLIITGCAVVSSDGVPFGRVMKLDNDSLTSGLEDLVSAVSRHGAVVGIQLIHYGRQSSTSFSGDVLMAPSALPCPVMSLYDPTYQVREMTLDDIRRVRDQFVSAAKRAAKAGIRVVEIHAAHGYLLSEFMSPYSNKRTDRYGGCTENRARLTVEIIEAVRSELGDRLAISVRVNGEDFVEGGLTADHYREISPLLENAGADMLNVSFGVYESMQRIVPPLSLGRLPHADITARVKAFTRVPVCSVGSIMDLENAEMILAAGKADLCAMGRAQTADPEIVKKSFENREEEINRCIQCNNCTYWTTGDPEMYCSVNPDYMKPVG